MRPDHLWKPVLHPVRDDYEQIVIAVGPRLSPGARAEEDDLIGVELINQSPDDIR
jgi:hypothetical protein